MKLHMEDKIAVVFGASTGIGAETARELAQEGAQVILIARREALLAQLCGEIRAVGGRADYIVADMGDDSSICRAVEEIGRRWGRIDILINTAAITAKQLSCEEPVEVFRQILAVDLVGVYTVCRRCLPLLADGGSIVNFTTIAAYVAGAGRDNYTAAKAGVSAVTRSLAVELAPRNIRVNAVCPGFVDTPMTAQAHGDNRDALVHLNLMGRAGQPEEIAKVVLFLASDCASFMTGQIIHVNGGQYMGV